MKKKYMKFMAFLAVVLPMTMMTSCDKEDEEKKNSESTEIVIDGNVFVKNNWLKYDENGEVIGLAVGEAIHEAEPTVAYVGVDDMKDAKTHFISCVSPLGCKTISNGDDITSILTDTDGNEINRINFTKINDGEVMAKAKLQKSVGIEQYVTEIRYISKSLWPENAIGGNIPFRTGCIYKFKGKNFVCVSTPGYGREGILVCDLNNYIDVYPDGQKHGERMTANYPNVNTCQMIGTELANPTTGPRLWQLFCATAGQTNMKEFKKRLYWTSTVKDCEVKCINFATNEAIFPEKVLKITFYPWVLKEGTHEWTLAAYRFYRINNGDLKIIKANNNVEMDYVEDGFPNPHDFVRNEELEKKADEIEIK